MKKLKVLALTMALGMAFMGCATKEAAPANEPEQETAINAETSSDEGTDEENSEDSTSAGEDMSREEALSGATEADVELINLFDGEGIAPDIDFSDCDTFTHIVGRKLGKGMGYANVKIGEEDVLLVSSGSFDNGDGQDAAIDATIYRYNEGLIEEVGKVACGGTAYPLAMKGDKLLCQGNHGYALYTTKDGKLEILEQLWAEYSENPDENAFYYYDTENGKVLKLKDEDSFWAMFDGVLDAEFINFAIEVR